MAVTVNGQENWFNEDAKFYKDVYVYGNLYYDFDFDTDNFQADNIIVNEQTTLNNLSVSGITTLGGSISISGSLSVSGNSSFSGIATFSNDVVIENNLRVGILTVTQKLDVGVGGTILTTSSGNIGLGKASPQAKLDVVGNVLLTGNLGVGSLSPEQKVDVDGSIKIDENIFDSVNTAGNNGFFLSRDAAGIRWVAPPPTGTVDGIFIENEGVLVGSAQSFTTLNFIGTGSGGDIVNATVNTGNSNIIDINIVDHWTKNGSGGIHTSLNVGIKNVSPSAELDVTGSGKFSQNLSVSGLSTFTGLLDANGGATIDDVRIGVGANNEIDTSSGNLVLDSAGGTVNVQDDLDVDGDLLVDLDATVTGNLTVSGVSTFTGLVDINDRAEIDNVRIDGNTVDTTTGNLVLDSNGGLIDINDNVDVSGSLTVTGLVDANGGATIDDVRIGVGADNEIDTSTGNLILDSAGGTVIVDDDLDVNSELNVDSVSRLRGEVQVDTGIVPDTDEGAYLGTSALPFSESHIGEIRIADTTRNTIDTATGNLVLDSNAGTIDINDNIDVSGTSTLQGEVIANTGIRPDTDEGAYLGTASRPFSEAHIGEVRIAIGSSDNTIDTASGDLILDSNSGTTQINDKLVVGSAVTVSSGNIDAAGVVTATKYFGDGSTLVGIVTQITAGIGISLSSTQTPLAKGKVEITAYSPQGKTVFVSQNGNDDNSGLAQNHAKRTVKAAAAIAFPGDTIKVYPGTYVEDNPIYLSRLVSVEGTELRNCIITPRNLDRDLFYVNNGCHMTDLSFIGPTMTDGAAIVALQPLLGVSTDRYFDAARMIRYNLDYIAKESVGFLTSGFSGFAGSHREQDAARLIDLNINFVAAEAVGFLTSTDYKNPAFTVTNAAGVNTAPVNCEDDIKDILRAWSYDLKAKSNKKAIGAGLSYYDDSNALQHITGISTGADGLQSYSIRQATIDALEYAVGIVTRAVINNEDWSTLSGVTTYAASRGITQDFSSYSPVLVSGGCTDVAQRIQVISGITTGLIGTVTHLVDAGISTEYGVTLESNDCADDVKDVWKCVIHDITRGGNSRCVAAGKSYFDADWNLIPQILKNPGEVEQTIATLDYSFNVARAVINNSSWGGYPVGLPTAVTAADYDGSTGIVTITTSNHGLSINDPVKVVGLAFTCPSSSGVTTSIFPDGTYGNIFNVKSVVGVNTFEVVVGTSTITHTYDTGGTVQKYQNFQYEITQLKDLSIQPDPDTGYNNAISGCANVVSALRSCIGVVTTIVGYGATAGINTTYPGNSGYGYTSITGITSAVYNNDSGQTTLVSPNLSVKEGDILEIRDLSFSCDSGGGLSTSKFPSGNYGYLFDVSKVNADGSFVVNTGVSTISHNYVGGGFVVNRAIGVTSALYDAATGITTVTAPGTVVKVGQFVELRNLEFSCSSGAGTTTLYPTGNNGYDFKVLSTDGITLHTATDATYDASTGISTITVPSHGFVNGEKIIIKDRSLIFTCASDGNTKEFAYPRFKDPASGKILTISDVTTNTFSVNVGASPVGQQFAHTFVKARDNGIQNITGRFTVNVGPSTIAHNYVGGGFVFPPYSPGCGNIVQGPYIRNCTNFVAGSTGMRINGFDAEPGDQNDIGVTGTMSVDSYTQYNQGGIGVSITNGAYAQLVSIFTICDDIAIFTGSGGQCDITNSNSSFGTFGLISDGVGDQTTGSIYHYTGVANAEAAAAQDTVVVSGIGSYRPYDGQAIYFGDLYYTVQSITVTDGGSNYTSSPTVVISDPTGPNGITAEASANISNGSVTSIDIISTGNQYLENPSISFVGGGGAGAAATANLYPIYYTLDNATLPNAGISTIVLNQNLNNTVSAGTTVYFTRLSLQITSSHSFEWVGSGNDIFRAKPALGGVVIQENEVVKRNGGEVVYTSTDQAGNFRIGDDLTINQLTGTITGRAFSQSLLNTVTPLIIALGN